MARQCSRSHDGTKPGEGTDDTSTSHLAHQAPGLAEGKAKWLETKLEVTMTEIQSVGGDGDESTKGGNQQDLSDRQEHRREMYQLAPISEANSGRGHRNQARRRRGDAVARAGERKETR
jgi:hypothetical protein